MCWWITVLGMELKLHWDVCSKQKNLNCVKYLRKVVNVK